LTTKTTDPYNSAAMTVDDPAIASAIRRHEERLARDPTSLVFAQLADLYRKVGRTRDAVALCREGLTRYPHYTTARLILAKACLEEGTFAEALAELQAVLEVSPKDVQCHRLAAEVHRRAGSLDAAVRHLETAVALDPGDRESRILMGLLRAEPPGNLEAGGLSRVLRDDTFVTMAFGTVCLEQGLADEAVQIFSRIVRRDPDNREACDRLETALRGRTRRKG
jgi:tetratricopeptide (TPR) repeat protein